MQRFPNFQGGTKPSAVGHYGRITIDAPFPAGEVDGVQNVTLTVAGGSGN